MQTHHQNQVNLCAAEIQAVLPELVDRHTPLIVVAALTEHVRGALFLTREAKVCTHDTAQDIVRRVTKIAFAR